MDVETTIHLKGSPFSNKNFLCMIALGYNNKNSSYTREQFNEAITQLKEADLWIGFNIKFDIHWIFREFGIRPKAVWDCQYAEFLFSNQTWKYPSLNESCIKRGLPEKIDVVKLEYWEKGIDTPDIPEAILREYAEQDIDSTYQLFLEQCRLFDTEYSGMFRLFQLHCKDLLVLQEMEFNGILYDKGRSLLRAEELDKQVVHLTDKLKAYCDAPINFDSREQLSKFLFGGTIEETYKVPVGVFKTGKKVGEVKYKNMIKNHQLPQLIVPLKGSEMSKPGIFSTEEETLKKLKTNAAGKKLITWILERSKIQKLNSTYLRGLPNVLEEIDWDDDILHSGLNQCVAGTGRLSSTKP